MIRMLSRASGTRTRFVFPPSVFAFDLALPEPLDEETT
jgi:hypothetical protein